MLQEVLYCRWEDFNLELLNHFPEVNHHILTDWNHLRCVSLVWVLSGAEPVCVCDPSICSSGFYTWKGENKTVFFLIQFRGQHSGKDEHVSGFISEGPGGWQLDHPGNLTSVARERASQWAEGSSDRTSSSKLKENVFELFHFC